YDHQVLAEIKNLGDDTLPAQFGAWKLEGAMMPIHRESSRDFGEYSKTWKYSGEALVAQVSLDYPFSLWHELSACYRNQGWELVELKIHKGENTGEPAHFVTQTMRDGQFRSGYLIYCETDSAGNVQAPPQKDTVKAAFDRWPKTLDRLFRRSEEP